MPFSSVLGASSAIKPGVCTSSTRPSTPYVGQLIFETDTNRLSVWNGSSWIYMVDADTPPGIELVKAETSFSAVSSVSADNVFSSTYTNYRMIIRFTTSAADLGMQFRASGVDTTSNYNWQQLRGQSTTASATRSTSQSSAIIADATSGSYFAYCTVEISGPNLAEPTVFSSVNAKTATTYAEPSAELRTGNQSGSTQFDGIKLLVASGTTTGSYTIYGYRKS